MTVVSFLEEPIWAHPDHGRQEPRARLQRHEQGGVGGNRPQRRVAV